MSNVRYTKWKTVSNRRLKELYKQGVDISHSPNYRQGKVESELNLSYKDHAIRLVNISPTKLGSEVERLRQSGVDINKLMLVLGSLTNY